MTKTTPYTPPALHLEMPLKPSSPYIPVLRAAPTPAPEEEPNLVGEQLGNFRLTRVLGKGGMGVVYLGEHVELDKRVAIKVLKRSLTQEPEIIARFFREARLLSRLRHPSIVSAYDGGFDPMIGRYLVMEYLDGESLQQYLARQGALSPFEAASIAWQLLDALELIHSAGIFHRDIKPANIYLTQSKHGPFVKLLDFGISKLLTPSDELQTATGIVLGTPLYLSPEQAVGKRDIDGRADLYSVAMVLYEMITGRRPFMAHNPQKILRMQQSEPPAPPSAFAPGLPLALERLILQGLEKNPNDRPGSAQAFRDALQDMLPSLPQRPLSPFVKEAEQSSPDSMQGLYALLGSSEDSGPAPESIVADTIPTPAPVCEPNGSRLVATSQERKAAQPKEEERELRSVLWAFGIAASVFALAVEVAVQVMH